MNFAYALPTVFAAIVVLPLPAGACKCRGPFDVATSFDMSAYVFAGRVIQVDVLLDPRILPPETQDPNKKLLRYGASRVIFSVSESWKGSVDGIMVVETNRGGGTCGFDFELGESYLVYAHIDRRPPHQPISVSHCGRTRPLSRAAEDLEALRSPP